MSINSICVVSPDFPTTKTIDFVFVDQLCRAMVDKGIDVNIIAPQSITKCIFCRIPIEPYRKIVPVTSGKTFTLLRPKYFSVGNAGGLLKNHNQNAFNNAVSMAFSSIHLPSVMYGHFWQSVKAAYLVSSKYDIPLFASSGEEIVTLERVGYSPEEANTINRYLSGAINVSSNNRNQCMESGLETREKSIVIPNAINNSIFYPYDKQECRSKLSLSKDDFVICFVGQFNRRKGPLKVAEAVRRINNPHIKVIFIGSGAEDPKCPGIVYKGRLQHDLLPEYLCASDVFVLPTLNEGCCNAIIEALACGLPVISSNLPFNHDILNDRNSIMIDPSSIDQLVESINRLLNDKQMRLLMCDAALESAKPHTLSNRVDRIIDFINKQISNDKK